MGPLVLFRLSIFDCGVAFFNKFLVFAYSQVCVCTSFGVICVCVRSVGEALYFLCNQEFNHGKPSQVNKQD